MTATKHILLCLAAGLFFCSATLTAHSQHNNGHEAPVTSSDTIRLLAIGNSFSEDAVEQNLYELAKAEGVELIIGNMYIGGCTVATHVANARNDAPAYQYRKTVDGVKTNRPGVKLSEALADEAWDFVSLQQASPHSGQYHTYAADLPALVEYVKSALHNNGYELVLHQTWAYAQNSTHSGFTHYGNSQAAMYRAIVEANRQAAGLVNINIIIPSGTAIQNGRTSYVGDNFTRDGYHLNDMGRYTAACTWMETLTGKNVVGNNWYPSSSLTQTQAELAQHAAHYAATNPEEITDMTALP
jgi:hypothetical protein